MICLSLKEMMYRRWGQIDVNDFPRSICQDSLELPQLDFGQSVPVMQG